jgi:peptidoglycan/LPS O-acetylase OafA/YrhL
MKPPVFAQSLVAAVAPASEYEIVSGDLYEEYRHIVDVSGSKAANRWYWAQTLLSIPSLLSYSRSNGSLLRGIGIALIAFSVLIAMAAMLMLVEFVYQALFGSADRSPCWLWPSVTYADAILFGAILARLVRTNSLRVAFFASLFLVMCFVTPALAGNPHSQAPAIAWIELMAVIPAMCFGAGLYQVINRRKNIIT